VRFQLDYVLDFAEPSESLEALSTVPVDMEEAYQLLIQRIEKRRRPTVVKILSWLFRARRPLKQDEIREAIAVRLDAKTLSKPLLHLDSLIQYCQGLVIMDDTTEIVRFSHFTVKEFLIVHFEDQLLSPTDCARLCLTYTNFEIFNNGPCSNKGQYEKRRNEYRFSEYVAQYWGSYAKGDAEHDEQVVKLLWKFFESRKTRSAIRQLVRLVSLDPSDRSGSRKIFKVSERNLNAWTTLHTVAYEGLAIFYEKYLSSSSICEERRQIDLGTVHSENEEGLTPLPLACMRGHSDVASLILADGADVMATGNGGKTSLHKAASEGHLGVAKLLLERDAKINAMDSNNWTPLHEAAWGGHDEVTKLLLDNGADINVEDNRQLTPLHRAASKGYHNVVKTLLSKGAEIHNPGNEHWWNPLHDAASGGHLEVVRLLLHKDPDLVNARDGYGRTPLYEAAWGGHIAVAELLLAKNADINAKDGDGDSPLHRAAMKGKVQLVSLLLDNGAEIDAWNHLRQTPLHKAVIDGHHEVFVFLQNRGAEINGAGNGERTPLHMAASTGDHKMVEILLDRSNAEVFAKDIWGRTPLHEAASRGREALSLLFAENNAYKGNFGWTPPLGPFSEWGRYITVISLLCKAPPKHNENALESTFSSLATAFAGEYLFWRTLGNEFLRLRMFVEAIFAYDMFVRKFVFRTTSVYDVSIGAFVNTREGTSNLECLDFQVVCQKCEKMVVGFHYKCKSCPWEITFCQNCVQGDWRDHEHTLEEILRIPSHWPLTPSS
jgi:ankyrin repeat protein